jgi:hypothetical protein
MEVVGIQNNNWKTGICDCINEYSCFNSCGLKSHFQKNIHAPSCCTMTFFKYCEMQKSKDYILDMCTDNKDKCNSLSLFTILCDLLTIPFCCGSAFYILNLRNMLRIKYSIDNNCFFEDIFISLCCQTCALFQHDREMYLRKQRYGMGVEFGKIHKDSIFHKIYKQKDFFVDFDDYKTDCWGICESISCKYCNIYNQRQSFNDNPLDLYLIMTFVICGDLLTFPFCLGSSLVTLKLRNEIQRKYKINNLEFERNILIAVCCTNFALHQQTIEIDIKNQEFVTIAIQQQMPVEILHKNVSETNFIET